MPAAGHCGGGGAQPFVARTIVIELSWFAPLLDPEPFAQGPISFTRSLTELTPDGTVKVPEKAKPFPELNRPLPICCAGFTAVPFD